MTSSNLSLNIQLITQLRDIMGNDFSKLIDTFVKDSAMRINDLDRALEEHNADAFRRSAHSFKGSAGNLGAIHLAELCRELEIIGAENRLEEAPVLMDRLKALYLEAENAIRAVA